jgi:hypothetical protein
VQIALQYPSNCRDLLCGNGGTVLEYELCGSRAGNRGDLLRKLIRWVVPAGRSLRRDKEDQSKHQQKWRSKRDHSLPRIITCDSHLDSHLGPHGETGLAARRTPVSNWLTRPPADAFCLRVYAFFDRRIQAKTLEYVVGEEELTVSGHHHHLNLV